MKVLLIDGFNLVRRLYEVRPHDDGVIDKEVITSATQSLNRALRQHQPTHVACIFDSHDKTWRHEIYPEYKANRKPTPQPLLDAIPQFEAAFLAIGVTSILIPGFEADDVIATLACGIDKAGGSVTILSADKNFLQLLNERISIYDHFKESEFTKSIVTKKYGVEIDQLVDYWALTGDTSSNIKGVPKIGPKTAQQLIQSHKSLDFLLQNPPADKTGERIKTHSEDARLCYKLMQLKTDIKVGVNLNKLRYQK
jgi:protein Xni